MTTKYEIKDDTETNCYQDIKNSIDDIIESDNNDIFIAKLDEINRVISTIKSVEKTNDASNEIITVKTEKEKIFFLATFIYKRLVIIYLNRLIKLKNEWEHIKDFVDKKLKLEDNKISHFFINPYDEKARLDNSSSLSFRLKKLVMYQLLLELIKNNFIPDINDVRIFISKITNI